MYAIALIISALRYTHLLILIFYIFNLKKFNLTPQIASEFGSTYPEELCPIHELATYALNMHLFGG